MTVFCFLPILRVLVVVAAYCCLLLLLAKLGRSTLDTKEGSKTKSGSTSSVTLTLTLCLTSSRVPKQVRSPYAFWTLRRLSKYSAHDNKYNHGDPQGSRRNQQN